MCANHSTWEAETEVILQFQGQLGLYSKFQKLGLFVERLSQKQTNNKEKQKAKEVTPGTSP